MDWQDATETLLQPLLRASRLGLLTDLDGTISPIVPIPDEARVTPENLRLLDQLAGVLPLVAIISGRSAPDIYRRVGLKNLLYVGNHGMERWEGSGAVVHPEAAPHRPALEAVIRQMQPHMLPGMILDDKGPSLSIHYRQAEAANVGAFRSLLQKLAAQHDLTMFEGRKVFELRPPIFINKGSILEELIEEYRLDAAVFMGDDTTDADGLTMARHLRQGGRCHAVGVGVVTDETPEAVLASADVLAQGVSGVETFLGWLFQAVSASSS